MTFTFALVTALCLAAPVLSQNAPCKVIAGASNFNFEEFIQYQYSYALGPNTNDVKTYKSAKETAAKVAGKWYSIFTANKKDGSQTNSVFLIDTTVKGTATIGETALNNGELTNTKFVNTFYAYKPKEYAQFYTCGLTGTTLDARYAVLFGEKTLTASLRAELIANDDKFGFNGDLITIA